MATACVHLISISFPCHESQSCAALTHYGRNLGLAGAFSARKILQAALDSHTLFASLPHLPQGQTDVHVLGIQSVRLVDSERNEARVIVTHTAAREGEEKWAVLVRLELLLLGLGGRWRRGRWGGRLGDRAERRSRLRRVVWMGHATMRLVLLL